MKRNPITRRAFALSTLAFTALALSSVVTVSAEEVPRPKPADLKKPVKIYLLSGQSNMTGRGNLGDLRLTKPAAEQQATLVRLIMDPQNVEKYKFLADGRSDGPRDAQAARRGEMIRKIP